MLDTERPNAGRVGGAWAPPRISVRGLFSRRWWTGVLTLVMSMGFATISASPASALEWTYIGTNFLRNWETGRCLDSNSPGAVYTNPCQQGNDYQKWQVYRVERGDYDHVVLMNQATRNCLYIPDDLGSGVSAVGCGPIIDIPVKPQIHWRAVGTSWNQVQFTGVDPANVNWYRCLDSNRNGSAYVQACNGGGFQKWKLGY